MSRRHTPIDPSLPAAVRSVLRDFPGISVVRAHQVARDRKMLLERAQRQAGRNRYGYLEAGGIGPSAAELLESFDQAGAVGCHLVPDFLETYETNLPTLGGLGEKL